MPLPYQLTNVGNPVVDATQLMANFNYLYGLWTGSVGNYQTGTYPSVPADGSASVAIPFPSTFPNTIGPVICTIANYNGSDAANAGLSWNIVGNPTRSGFTIIVQGGLPTTTCTINWMAAGT